MLSSCALSGSGGLELTGDVSLFVDGPLTLADTAAIDVAEGASLTLFARGDVDLSGAGIRNLSGGTGPRAPGSVRIVLVAPPAAAEPAVLTLGAGGELAGVVYAPDARLVVASATGIFGAVLAETLELGAPLTVHYDQAIAAVEIPSVTQYAAQCLAQWRPVAAPAGTSPDPLDQTTLDQLTY